MLICRPCSLRATVAGIPTALQRQALVKALVQAHTRPHTHTRTLGMNPFLTMASLSAPSNDRLCNSRSTLMSSTSLRTGTNLASLSTIRHSFILSCRQYTHTHTHAQSGTHTDAHHGSHMCCSRPTQSTSLTRRRTQRRAVVRMFDWGLDFSVWTHKQPTHTHTHTHWFMHVRTHKAQLQSRVTGSSRQGAHTHTHPCLLFGGRIKSLCSAVVMLTKLVAPGGGGCEHTHRHTHRGTHTHTHTHVPCSQCRWTVS